MSTQTTTQPHGLVHIDRIKVLLPCIHKALGNDKWEFTAGDTGEIRQAANGQSGSLEYHESKYYVHSKKVQPCGVALELELDICPPKLIQRHNVFGHSNLVRYVVQGMEKLLVQAPHFKHVVIRPEDIAEWARGNFRVYGVHLTANYHCPRDQVLHIINAIDTHNSSGKHRNIATSISLGYSGNQRSALRTGTVYDKYLERQSAWKAPGPIRQQLLNYIRDSVRVEIKLFSANLKKLGLDIGAAWLGRDVDALYFSELERLNLWTAAQPTLNAHELSSLKDTQRNAYIAWLHGTPFDSLFDTRQTGAKHAAAILKAVGVNIKQPVRPKHLMGINTAEVFTAEKILSIPDWLRDSEFFISD